MDSTLDSAAPAPPPTPSLWGRTIAVFTRPQSAWGGLTERAHWWFPLLLFLAVATASSIIVYQRAVLPVMTDSMEQQVANGQMTQEQFDRIEPTLSQPLWMAFTIVPQVVVMTLVTLVVALMVWFGAGFVLGAKLSYRLALEVAAWSGLVAIPGQILTSVLGWFKGNIRLVHIGFGALLPEVEPPTKLWTALGVFLDALGPFSLWYLAVLIIGAAALSGAPRKSLVWVLGGLYLVVMGLLAALAALAVPSA